MIKIHVVDSLPLAPSYYGREGYRIVDTQVKVEELIQFNPLLKTKIAITINTEKAQSSLLKLAEENDNPLLEITFITDSIEKVSEALYSRAGSYSEYVPIYGKVLETFKDKYPTTTYEFIKKHELEYITALEELSESDFGILLQLAEIFVEDREQLMVGNAIKVFGVVKSLNKNLDIRTLIEMVQKLTTKDDLRLAVILSMHKANSIYEQSYKTQGDSLALFSSFVDAYLGF